MSRPHYLKESLDSLVAAGRSGLVVLCGDSDVESSLEYMIYFHSLGIIYIVHGDMYSEYFNSDAAGFTERALSEFSNRSDYLSLSSIDRSETEFLDVALSDLLWHMTHAERDADDFLSETETLARLRLHDPESLEIVQPVDTFTLFGKGSLERDILRFHELLLNRSGFSVLGQRFSLGSGTDENGKTVYLLSLEHPDTFVDDATGESIPVVSTEIVLSDSDWRGLYARTRSFISGNFGSGV